MPRPTSIQIWASPRKPVHTLVAKRGRATLMSVFAAILFMVSELSYAQTLNGSEIRVEFSKIGDASHFEFEGNGSDRYKIERNANGEVVLRIPNLSEASIRRLQDFTDGQVKIVKLDPKSVDGSVEIRFRTEKDVDYFDYVSDQPKRLVVDFFPAQDALKDAKSLADASKKSEAVNKVDASSEATGSKTVSKATKKTEKSRDPAGGDFVIVAKQGPTGATTLVPEPSSVAEQIASRKDFERGIFDGGDPEFRRFTVKDFEIRESARFKSKAALRIPFPMLDLGFPNLSELRNTPPIYEILPKDTQENKEARLLLTLFKNNRQALLLSTAKLFLKKYPESEYDEIVRYVMADTHYALWRQERDHNEEHKIKSEANLHDSDFEEAMGLYNNLVERYPDSPMTTRTLLLVGYSYLDRGDSFGALKTFQRFVRLKPDSKYAGQVKISIARAFLSLNRWEDALKELTDVETSAKSTRDRHEAAFRRGDVYFRRGDYAKAIAEYDNAIKTYPQATGRFPNAYYNLAESRFRLGQEKQSIDGFRQFLQKFPEHRHGGFAMTRLGELIEILVGANDPRVTGAFFESYFRFRSTPGADIARMRVLTARIPQMQKDRELKDAIAEIDEIVKRDSDLPFIHEFRLISVADAFHERKEFDRASKELIQFYKENTQSKHLPLIKGRIVRNMADVIQNYVNDGDFLQGLRRYSRDQSGWLKGVRRADISYFVGKAYEAAGVNAEAANHYKETLNRLDAQTPDTRDVFETPIAKESVQLRLAAVAAEKRDFSLVETHLKLIKDVAVLTEAEQSERAGLAADLAEARGQMETARKYLAEVIRGMTAKNANVTAIAPLHLRSAKLALKSNDLKAAELSIETALSGLEKNMQQTKSLSAFEKQKSEALEIKAQIAMARSKPQDAIQAYTEILALSVAKSELTRKGFDSVRYRLGQLQFETGDLKAAETTWKSLVQEETNLWRRLASEQMSGAKWKEEYKKYIERIPAAAEIR